ncbi:putative integral membrane protein [Babesia bovis T2Bo]|uniref:putative integral membrane protein n=1 Tax=Babesia bovis T2Bo TaxID=484906 RepID=UPI001D9534E4|nr:putative integral membrane protein [Babesia bovis T2Bo]KAG6439975.1 putative integral membrane protein [Babesia bovis T2Bo]
MVLTGIVLKLSKAAIKKIVKDNAVNAASNEEEDGTVTNNEDKDEESLNTNFDWTHLNYPWGLKLVHYNANELETKPAKFTKIAHISTFVVYATLLLNLINVIALAIMGIYPMRILYSFFNIILIAPVVCMDFYLLYVTLATKNPLYIKSYNGMHTMLCLLYLVLAILGEGPVNGFTKFIYISTETPKSMVAGYYFWMAAIILESCLHMISFLFGGKWHFSKLINKRSVYHGAD